MIKWKTTMFVDVRRSDCVFFLYFVTFNFVIFDIEHKWKHAQNEQKRTNKKKTAEKWTEFILLVLLFNKQ